MTDRKEEIIEMLKEIKNPKSIVMIFGFVRAAYRDEKIEKAEEAINRETRAKGDCEA